MGGSFLLHKFWLFTQHTLRKGISMFQFTAIKTFTVVVRRIIIKGKAGTLLVIEVNIAMQHFSNIIFSTTFL